MFGQVQIQEMVMAIVRIVDPVSVILFGSYARGDVRDGSDVDLLVVEREGFDGKRSRWNELRTIRNELRPFKCAKDILVYSYDEVMKLRDSPNHVVGKAYREGKVLYEV